MKKSFFSVNKDLEKEAKNWWSLANYTFYDLDMKKKLPRNIFEKIYKKKYSEVCNLIKFEIKKNRKEDIKEFNWLKYDFLPYLQKKEEKIISRLDKIHNKKFPVKFVKLYFTSLGWGYYGKEKEGFWINIHPSSKNKDSIISLIIHELMHLYFGIYFRKICFDRGLKIQEIEDIKEAFTILINNEFKDLIKEKDIGYKEHKRIRRFILKEWKKNKNFKKVLENTIKFYKSIK